MPAKLLDDGRREVFGVCGCGNAHVAHVGDHDGAPAVLADAKADDGWQFSGAVRTGSRVADVQAEFAHLERFGCRNFPRLFGLPALFWRVDLTAAVVGGALRCLAIADIALGSAEPIDFGGIWYGAGV